MNPQREFMFLNTNNCSLTLLKRPWLQSWQPMLSGHSKVTLCSEHRHRLPARWHAGSRNGVAQRTRTYCYAAIQFTPGMKRNRWMKTRAREPEGRGEDARRGAGKREEVPSARSGSEQQRTSDAVPSALTLQLRLKEAHARPTKWKATATALHGSGGAMRQGLAKSQSFWTSRRKRKAIKDLSLQRTRLHFTF